MDGYAVRFDPGNGPTGYRLRPGLVVPGGRAPSLAVGEAIAVTTGATVPTGTDAVVRKERALVASRRLRVRRRLRRGTDIHRAGEHIRIGTTLLRRGERVRPYHVALLTAQGISRLRVRAPRLEVLAIGDELSSSDRHRPGRVRDSISPLMGALTAQVGPATFRTVPDDLSVLTRALHRAARSADFIVTIGGTSVGEKDFTKRAVRTLGRLLFEGVRVNVLKRGAVGLIKGVPVVLLPGQVVSAVVVWHEHGLRVLARRLGTKVRRAQRVRLTRRLTNPHPMDSVYLFRIAGNMARPCRWGVQLYSELLRANAFGVVRRHSVLRAGTPLDVQRLEGSD